MFGDEFGMLGDELGDLSGGNNSFSGPRSVRAPLTILCGFLGSGKTTVVQHILRNREGLKIGVVVNDIAEANIDSAMLAFEDADGIVGLQNGCACCSGRDDLFTRLEQLSKSAGRTKLDKGWDRLVVECTGAAQPLAIAEQLQSMSSSNHPLMKRIFLAGIVCVLDASSFMSNYNSTHSEWTHSDGWLPELLTSQLECSDTLIINKVDLMPSQGARSELTELVQSLNSNARRFEVSWGDVPLHELLPAEPLDIATMPYVPTLWSRHSIALRGARQTEHHHDHKCDHSCDHHHHHHSGISSFVYSRKDRKFSRLKLTEALQHSMPVDQLVLSWAGQEPMSIKAFDGPVAGVLRSKGFCMMDSDPDMRWYWSHAGRQLQITECPAARLHRGIELVFIGHASSIDQHAIYHWLDQLLVE